MCHGSHPYIPVTGVLKNVLQYTVGADIAQNDVYVHHVDGSTWTSAQITAMANTIRAAWVASLKPFISNTVTLTGIHSTDLSSQSGAFGSQTYADTGSDTVVAMPNGVSFVSKLTTAQRGRSFRGRIYTVGISDHRLSSDEITHSYGDSLNAGWGAVLTAINGVTNCEMVVVSLCSGGSWRTTGVATKVLGVSLTDYFLDYQRRRATAHARHG